MICACPRKEEFEPRRPNQKYRSSECRLLAKKERSVVIRLNRREHVHIKTLREFQRSPLRWGNPIKPPLGTTPRRRMQYEPLLTTAKVAEFLNVSEWTVRWWRMRSVQLGPAFIRLGKTRGIRYLPKDVIAFLRKHRSCHRARPSQAGTAGR
jgi:Helix-turn-helix domain